MLKLVTVGGEYPLNKKTWKVGRAPTNDIVISDGMMSSSHAVFANGKVQDLGSSNGTTLDGRKLKPQVKYALRSGSVVECGQTKFFVRSGTANNSQELSRSKRFGPNEMKLEEEEKEDPDKHLTAKELMDREFPKIVGHSNLKKQLEQFYKKVRLDEIRASNGRLVEKNRLYHMIFQGPPGTGKTTMANLVAKMMLKMRLVKSDKVVFVNNALELLAGYKGQTPAKVNAKVEEASGGVLFIDEAYSIVKSQDKQQDSFGKEAIDSIMKHLDPPSCVFIFAGYEQEMKDFMSVNSGLARRVPYRYTFTAYSLEELTKIFIVMCDAKGEIIGEEEKLAIPGLLQRVDPTIMETQNAGFVENWLAFSQIERDDRLDIEEARKNPQLAITLRLVDLQSGLEKSATNQSPADKDSGDQNDHKEDDTFAC